MTEILILVLCAIETEKMATTSKQNSRDIRTPDNVEHPMAVREFWRKRDGQWLIHGYSGTLMK